jgi:hypothetical protein
MSRRQSWNAVLGVVGWLGAISPSFAANVDFTRDVLPILSSRCFPCHGPDAGKRKADLRLDVRDAAVTAKALTPGRPAESNLISRVSADDDDGRMPPAKTGQRLAGAEVRLLRDWIEQGAPYSEHWAFVPPKRPALPNVRDTRWPRSPIDAFVLERLETHKLRPAEPASREVLIRRATLDLTGLPPTPEQVAAFVADRSPSAYERLIDRLLASPHYGERWGRHWLDVARYADSGGFETDIVYANAWRYRDYVVRSFNADKPFARFVGEQIAGDEIIPNDREALVATGLYAIGPVLEEAKMVAGKLDYDWLTDAADTTGSAFLGLTFGCARCHDHKYDPISQRDYFGLQAIFATSDLCDFNADGSLLKEHVALTKTEKQFDAARKKSGHAKRPVDYDEYDEIPIRGLRRRSQPYEVRLLKRGELESPREAVAPALPAKFATDGATVLAPSAARKSLADWLASDRNPLTSRVIVNRVWQWHFGQGLVHTPNDFGTRGERPTHPELLDWLAVDFVENGWSLKRLHRRIMLSAAYQMSSAVGRETLRQDPDNRLLTRFQPRRVEAEAVWDSIRAVAGTLDHRMYGLPIGPPLDSRELIGNYRKWPAGLPEDANRRAVYVVVRRSFRFPALSAFDLPENVASCGQRDCTVVANQALALVNNRGVREQAAAFAARLLRETDGTAEAVAARAWLYAYGRTITPGELCDALTFLRANEKSNVTEGRLVTVAELCAALFNTNEFIYLP